MFQYVTLNAKFNQKELCDIIYSSQRLKFIKSTFRYLNLIISSSIFVSSLFSLNSMKRHTEFLLVGPYIPEVNITGPFLLFDVPEKNIF